MKKAAIKKMSEETHIPFPKLLAGYVFEELLALIGASEYGESLWLKNEDAIGIEQYRRETDLTLSYLCPNPLSLKMGYQILGAILQKDKTPQIKWRGGAAYENGRIELSVTGEFEEMVVPIGIQIVEVEGTDVTPEKRDFEPFLREGERVFYWREPPAAVLAEQFFLILQNMELVVQMSPYERIWDILSKESVDGRHVGELLRENCEKGEIPFEPHRVEEVVAYKNYTFMRKRWEKHLKKRKMDHPGWEEVMEYVEAFLPAIWNTICRNEIFFGDWMPGIRRFLD